MSPVGRGKAIAKPSGEVIIGREAEVELLLNSLLGTEPSIGYNPAPSVPPPGYTAESALLRSTGL